MKLLKFKMFLASISKRTWIYIAAISAFIALAVAGLFVWMHLCGYTFAQWIAQYWPIVVIVIVAIALLAFALTFSKLRKARP